MKYDNIFNSAELYYIFIPSKPNYNVQEIDLSSLLSEVIQNEIDNQIMNSLREMSSEVAENDS